MGNHVPRGQRVLRIAAAIAFSGVLAFLLATGGGGTGDGPPYATESDRLRAFQTFFNDVDFRAYQRIEFWEHTTENVKVETARVVLDVFDNGTDNEGLVCAGNRIQPPGFQWRHFVFTPPVTVSNSPRTFISQYYGQDYNKNPNGYVSTFKMSDVHEVGGEEVCAQYTNPFNAAYDELLPGVRSIANHTVTYWEHDYCQGPPC